MNTSRWFPLVAGALLGLAIALFYAWNVNPVAYVNSDPASLRQSYREEYMALIALAYASTGDLDRAQDRLALFDLEDPEQELAALAQKHLANSENPEQAQAFALLAAELEESRETASPRPSSTQPLSRVTPATPTPTQRSRPSPRPSPTATPAAPFELVESETICDPDLERPLLQMVLLDSEGEGIPGVELEVLWGDGEDRFFTGLKPEISPGYADFQMSDETAYSVHIADARLPITGITSPTCELESGEEYSGSMLLIFQQPQ